jgi:hypothetical protein
MTYQVFGPGVPQLRGRAKDWTKLMRRLEKPVPDHVSLVGVRYIGKTVFLNAVATYFADKHDHFDACVYWNVGHDLPQNDASFYRAFAKHATKPVSTINAEIGAYLDSDDIDYEVIKDVFDMLKDDGKKVLVIMDSLDNLLLAGELTKNLWDSLRALAEMSSLRFLTGSQKRLREIVGSPEARTSPFWNLFADSTLILSAFDDGDDWMQMLAPFADRGIELQPGARTELFNYSGGIPVLASALCKRVWDDFEVGASVNDGDIKSLADGFADDTRQILDDLWNDCSEEEWGVVAELATGRALKAVELSRACLLTLKQRGFVREKGRELKACRTVEQYVKTYRQQATELPRLFNRAEDYNRNIKSVIKLRFGQLETVDEELIEHIRFAIDKLDTPKHFVTEIRGLVNRAFTIIWASELRDRRIPAEWTAGWRQLDRNNRPLERNPPEGIIPDEGGRQCYLLSLMTDSRRVGETRISRPTYFMLHYLQSVGDFGQHLGNSYVSHGFTYTVCLTAIEMCEQLSRDLSA